MNFFKDKELALRFKNNAVSSKERFLYLFASVGLAAVLSSNWMIFIIYKQPSWLDAYMDVARIAIHILGTTMCYRTNKFGDDKEYIKRFISIGFPVLIRTFCILMPVAIILGITAIALTQRVDILDEGSVYNLAFSSCFEFCLAICLYWRLNSSIKLAANS